jgi:hypothetical protein
VQAVTRWVESGIWVPATTLIGINVPNSAERTKGLYVVEAAPSKNDEMLTQILFLVSPPASPLGIKAQIKDEWEIFPFLEISVIRGVSLWK